MRIELAPECWALHRSAFLAADEADRLHSELQQELAWEQRAIVLYGRNVLQPRLIAWAGALPYRYSGQTLPARPFTRVVAALTERVQGGTGVAFNHVLANRYRDGRDSMGLHADAEPELGPLPVVATLSFGVARRLVVVPRKRPEPGNDDQRHSFDLAAGDLFVMGGACQRDLRHGIPRQLAVTGERISLTFRLVVRAPVT